MKFEFNFERKRGCELQIFNIQSIPVSNLITVGWRVCFVERHEALTPAHTHRIFIFISIRSRAIKFPYTFIWFERKHEWYHDSHSREGINMEYVFYCLPAVWDIFSMLSTKVVETSVGNEQHACWNSSLYKLLFFVVPLTIFDDWYPFFVNIQVSDWVKIWCASWLVS